jgi:ubiquinone biosynthesis protein COQ9
VVEESKSENFTNPKHAILAAALTHVEKYGWTEAAVSAGAIDCGYVA